jgi:hypothetical protein
VISNYPKCIKICDRLYSKEGTKLDEFVWPIVLNQASGSLTIDGINSDVRYVYVNTYIRCFLIYNPCLALLATFVNYGRFKIYERRQFTFKLDFI